MAEDAMVNEEQLVARMARKDQDALAALYDLHRGIIFTLAFRILNDRAEAEEVLAEVFSQAWRSAGSYDPVRVSVSGWLINLGRSRAIERVRTRGRRNAGENQPASSQNSATAGGKPNGSEEPESFREKRERISELLSLLPPDQRAAIELAYYGGLSHSEISRELGEPLDTIKTRIRQGLIALRANFSASFVP